MCANGNMNSKERKYKTVAVRQMLSKHNNQHQQAASKAAAENMSRNSHN